jgi:hypothetical protein
MAKIPVTDCPAGPALDAAVAKVLGWTDLTFNAYTPVGRKLCGTHPSGKGGFDGHGRMIVTRWSEDIARAWELWCAMDGEKRLHEYSDGSCTCFLGGMSYGGSSDYADGVHASADKAPLAITRAFLLAHGGTEVEVPDD